MYRSIPTGVGAARRDLRLGRRQLTELLEEGASWAVRHGFGHQAELDRVEEHGCLAPADPSVVSARALERGQPQLGTLGSGNHFVELQYVAEIYDERAATAFGLRRDQLTAMIHSALVVSGIRSVRIT